MHAAATLTLQKILVQAMIGRLCVSEEWALALFDTNRAAIAIDEYIDAFTQALNVRVLPEDAATVKQLIQDYTQGSGGASPVKVSASGSSGASADALTYAIFEVVRLAKCPHWPCTGVS